MPTNPDATAPVTCFYTTVRNISGVEKTFGFLGKHSKRLEAGEQYTVPGNIIDQLAKEPRKFNAMERAVAGFTDQAGNDVDPTLAIVSTPAVHLYDDTADDTKVLTLDNGTLGKSDPCWGAYSST